MSPETTMLTYEERVKMRRMLDALDQKEAAGRKEFDLNKPPTPTYFHQEYPFLMYHKSEKPRGARDREEREVMLAAGWSERPITDESPAPVIPLTPAEQAEAEDVEKKLTKRRA